MENKVLIIGPLAGKNSKIISQGTILAKYLTLDTRFKVIATSNSPSRFKRFYDIVSAVITNRDASIAIILVFSYLSFAYVDFASFLLRKLHIPIVFWLHGGALPEFSKKYKPWVKHVLKRGNVLVAPSEYLIKHFRESGFRNTKIIRNIIDLENYNFKERKTIRPKFLWMRKFHPIWNPKMALHVFKNILNIYPEATLVMAGSDAGYMGECINMAKKLGIYEQIKFPGFLNHEEKVEYMNKNDIYLHTNLIDNVPVSVVEALASGMIVVGTRVGGMSYLIKDNINGFLVDSNDVDTMTEKILEILSGKYNISEIQKNGYATAQEFHYKNVIKEWKELIEVYQR